MGDWYPDPNNPGKWIHDDAAPDPGRNPAVTQMLPIVHATPYPDPGVLAPKSPSGFEKDDGTVYGRVDPDEFDSYDDVDSRTIVDPGAPA